MQLRNIRIGSRAGLSFALLAVLMLVLGVFALVQMNRMDDRSDEVNDNWLPSILTLNQLSGSVARIRALTLRAVILIDARERQATFTLIDGIKRDLEAQQSAYEALVASDEERAIYERLRAALTRYLQTQEQVVDAIGGGRQEEAVSLVNGSLAEYADAVVAELTTLATFNSDGAQRAGQKSNQVFADSIRLVVILLVVTVVLTVLIALLLTRSLVKPLAEAVAAAERVASGDLSQEIRFQGKDEPALLLGALRTMQGSLRDTIQRISDSSRQLASASEELHAVTEDSTRGLHQQSNEIEQAATAVNQMTAAVEEVARNAVSTSEATQETDRIARQGGNQVAQAVESIRLLASDVTLTSEEVEQLAAKVRNISQVLDVIRAIAEQTNLLALNAAIEAARAGDAGRGFAVVADEVRALAHRTQQSTQEIEQMIGGIQASTEKSVSAMHSSNARTHSTLEIAQAAGGALEQITQAIAAINERNLVIASASEQQAQVAREVDRNLVNIRDLSQQTSAGANQTSVSSQELSRLAIDLNALVAQFRT